MMLPNRSFSVKTCAAESVLYQTAICGVFPLESGLVNTLAACLTVCDASVGITAQSGSRYTSISPFPKAVSGGSGAAEMRR